jgi:hypothetical protein
VVILLEEEVEMERDGRAQGLVGVFLLFLLFSELDTFIVLTEDGVLREKRLIDL